jgi:hypothetical protein
MSQCSYNGLEFGLVKTNSIVRETRLSDDRTEYMWTDWIIDISTVYSPSPFATSYPDSSLPEITDSNIRFLLMQPRQPLVYSEGGETILNVTGPNYGNGVVDCENGPTPLSCTVTRIASSRLFFVRFIIKASILECPVGTTPLAVASSRYSRIETIDKQYRSTITMIGQAKFRSNVLVEIGQNSDAFRGYIIPGVMRGFKRNLIRVVIDSNGLGMQWSTVDEEQFIDLGSANAVDATPGTAGYYGITEMDLEYQTSSNPAGNAEGIPIAGILGATCTVNAMALGTRWANTFTMLQFLFSCAMNRLAPLALGSGLAQNFSVSENTFKNTVQMSLTYWLLPGQNEPLMYGIVTGTYPFVGTPILSLPSTGGIEPQPPFSNATRGFDAYQLAVNAFATACYTSIGSIGGCDQSGAIPPDVSNYNGQCNANPQVVVYPSIPFAVPSDRRVPGKQGFRSINPTMPPGYVMYDVREDVKTNTGMEVVAQSTTPSSGGGGGGSLGNSSIPTPTSGTNYSGSNPQTTMATLQLYQPTGYKVVRFAIKRLGCIPEVPDPTPAISGYVLLEEIKTPVCTEVGPDGYTLIYSISGTYTYGMTIPAYDHDTIPFSLPPWVANFSQQYNEVIAGDYYTGIANIPPV